MNNWMSEPFAYPDKPLDRGKVLTAEDLKKLGGFARYRDVDGDAHRLAHAARNAIIPRRRTLRAARDTTMRPVTPRSRTSTRQ